MAQRKTTGRMYVWIIILLFLVLACLVWYLFGRRLDHIDKKLEESRTARKGSSSSACINKGKEA